MDANEFSGFVLQDEHLAGPMQRAAGAYGRGQYALAEAAAIVLLFPVARFIVTNVGLPWLHEGGRWAELYRLKFRDWIDSKYNEAGFDPDAAERAGEALREELTRTTDRGAQQAWENLQSLIAPGSGDALSDES